MPSTRGRVARGLTGAAVTLAASVTLGAGTASAVITQTAITTPSSPFYYQFDHNASPTPTVTISGTTNSTAPGSDAVDINCYYAQGGNIIAAPVASDIVTDASGNFSYTGPINTVYEEPAPIGAMGRTCTLRAVPAGDTSTSGLSQYAGPFSELDYLNLDGVIGAGNSPPYADYFYTATSTGAYDDYDSVGGCGLDYSYAMQPGMDLDDGATWFCAGALYHAADFDEADSSRSEIQVDGEDAYDSQAADYVFDGGGNEPGFPALTSSYAKDPATGGATIEESEDIVECPSPVAYPPTASDCGSWVSSGVSFHRTISESEDGELVTMTDRFTSTDNRPHRLSLQYDDFGSLGGEPVWDLPGTAGYATYSSGDAVSLPPTSTGVISAQDGILPDGNTEDGPGSIVYSTQPTQATFFNHQDMLLDYVESVPAGGSVSITQSYVTAYDNAEREKVADAQAEETARPMVSITSPADGSTVSASSVEVSGTASAFAGLSLTVDGAAVPVNSDGTWSTAVALDPGANTITASASDDSGNTAQASETVIDEPQSAPVPSPHVSSPPVPTTQWCIVPKVAKDTLAKAKAALKKAHCAVGTIHKVRSKTFRKDRIEHASRSAGTALKADSKVGLTESIGKPRKRSKKRGHRARHVSTAWLRAPSSEPPIAGRDGLFAPFAG